MHHDDDEGLAFRREIVAPAVPSVLWGWSPAIPTMLPDPKLIANYDREDYLMGQTSNDLRRLTTGDVRRFNATLQHLIRRAVTVDGAQYSFHRDGIRLFGVDEHGAPTDDSIFIDARKSGGAGQVSEVQEWYARAVVQTETAVHLGVVPVYDLEPAVHLSEPSDWHPYVNSNDEVDPRFEARDGKYRCIECAGTEKPFVTDNSRSLAGHFRLKHTDDRSMFTEEARDKALDSRRYNPLRTDVELCIEILSSRLGVPYRDEITALKQENGELRAKLALISETLGLS